MKVEIAPGWKKKLNEEFENPYFQNLAAFVKDEYENHKCFPAGRNIFAAFEFSKFEDTKVVILGQDPYHGIGQAHGLAFSVKEDVQVPPSLKNIFREIETDLGKPVPDNGNLERWAKQGVLLLNATLTVRAHEAGSHQNKGWEQFTDRVIEIISAEKENVVFLLWGGYAKKKAKKIDASKHLILTSGHPSPLSANRGYWFCNKHFSKANEYLKNKGKEPVDW
ncbi:uracil-DNA glycosylase [Autumnicola psychrophila]|uniref:Uracil-DNA glycosylase n=1 Tax=Autumnicola psychrophila TaxID=3075592 RepID=A0ABU3DPP9_9FLAO|nr:uracil-DNA glycosylase [Zunongwangia sp. F225]MDT0685691.1 uracil-DNA glycosylase [Zunongwangia sp. F225]